MRPALLITAALPIGLLSAALAVPAPREAAPQDRAPADRDWSERLAALTPSDPLAYFELGEEVADVAADPAQRRLAQRLFALAGLLDREHLGRSACLALADLSADDRERRRFLALASLLGPGGVGQTPFGETGPGLGRDHPAGAIVALTEAFSLHRRGEGGRAMSALRKPGAMELLDECDRFLPGGKKRFLEECHHYRADLRPNISDEQLTRMLRLEAALLAGEERPWSSELLFGGGRPLVEVDPDRLEDAFGTDVTRPVYRAGRWVEGGDGDDRPGAGSGAGAGAAGGGGRGSGAAER